MKPSPQHPRPKILVADDEPQILELIRKALDKEGYAVVTATGFEEAVTKAHTEPFDIIILDTAMPDTPTSFTPDGTLSGTDPKHFEDFLRRWHVPTYNRPPHPMSALILSLLPARYKNPKVCDSPYPMGSLMRLLRPQPDSDTPPVIFLSFKTCEFYNWDMGDANNFFYVTKPFHSWELLQFVHRLLSAPGP